jgi:hypothetical protein
MEPLIRRTDEEATRKNYSTIKTTPESIVRIYRQQKARREPFEEPVENPHIVTPRRPRIPWYKKINWEFAVDAVCVGVLAIVALWFLIYVVGPFVRLIWIV